MPNYISLNLVLCLQHRCYNLKGDNKRKKLNLNVLKALLETNGGIANAQDKRGLGG